MHYICTQEPKARFRHAYHVFVVVVDAKSRADAKLQYAALLGGSSDFKAVKAEPIEVGKIIRT